MSATNLDQVCAQFGYAMADETHKAIGKNAENHITKSLGVLQEDGVYAFFLYQASRKGNGADQLREQAHALLAKQFLVFENETDSLLAVRGDKSKKGLAENLDQLLLAKRLLEQALIYARYHAKALG